MTDPRQDDDQVISRLSRELTPLYGQLHADDEGPSPAALKAKIMARVVQEKQWPRANPVQVPVLERWVNALRRFWWMPTLAGAAAAVMLVVNTNPTRPTAVLHEMASGPTRTQAPSSEEQLSADLEETSKEIPLQTDETLQEPAQATAVLRRSRRVAPGSSSPFGPAIGQAEKVSDVADVMDDSDMGRSSKRAESAPAVAKSAAPSAPMEAERKPSVPTEHRSRAVTEDRAEEEVLASAGAGAASGLAPRFEVERAEGFISHRLWKRAFEAYSRLIQTYPMDSRVTAWKKTRDVAALRAAE